jgi:aspartate 1-decarboxylase
MSAPILASIGSRDATAWRGSPPGMLIHVLKSKIHRARITAANVNYEGSLTIDRALMDKVGFVAYERILCSNMANGERFETYVIPGENDSADIVLNGATAHLGKIGDMLTIMSFTEIDITHAKFWKPRVIVLGEGNAIVNERGI